VANGFLVAFDGPTLSLPGGSKASACNATGVIVHAKAASRSLGQRRTGPRVGLEPGGSCASQRIAFQLASTLGAQSLRATGSRASSQGANSLVVQCCFPPPHAIPFRGPRDGLLRPGHSPSKARPVRETVAVPVLEGSCWVAWSSLGANLRDIT
jgi:hypothetical protein